MASLNDRQRKFVTAYCDSLNATKAAITAGYSEKTARSMGSENLTKPDIRAEIDRIFESRSMGRGEVKARITEIARGDMEDFLTVEGDEDAAIITPNLGKAKANGKLKLIKKIKIKQRKLPGEGGTETSYEFELYDALAAQKMLGIHHGIFAPAEDGNDDEGEGIGDEAMTENDLTVEAALHA